LSRTGISTHTKAVGITDTWRIAFALARLTVEILVRVELLVRVIVTRSRYTLTPAWLLTGGTTIPLEVPERTYVILATRAGRATNTFVPCSGCCI
jgi:hypothetical protein